MLLRKRSMFSTDSLPRNDSDEAEEDGEDDDDKEEEEEAGADDDDDVVDDDDEDDDVDADNDSGDAGGGGDDSEACCKRSCSSLELLFVLMTAFREMVAMPTSSALPCKTCPPRMLNDLITLRRADGGVVAAAAAAAAAVGEHRLEADIAFFLVCVCVFVMRNTFMRQRRTERTTNTCISIKLNKFRNWARILC